MKKAASLVLVILLMSLVSCKKNKPKPEPELTATETPTNFEISYEVDGKALVADTMIYTNPFNVPYSVTRLQYFISDIKLYTTEGNTWSPDSQYFYLDGIKYPNFKLPLGKVPMAHYNKIEFNIGLPPALNHHDSLVKRQEITDMIWPTMMGGGFHFLKFEGHFKEHPDSAMRGFAMHLGTNSALVKVTINLQNPISISGSNEFNIPLVMNLNEWFRNPNDYNFATEKAYIMNDSLARVKVAQNGQDVFYYKGN